MISELHHFENFSTDCVVICLNMSMFNNNNNSFQFNSIRVYLRANLTAQKPITKLARVHRSTQK
jgi:hypothetical protein